MNKITTLFTRIAFLAVLACTMTACDSNDGPLEKTGESIDKAATDMGNKVEDACEDAKEGLGTKDTDC